MTLAEVFEHFVAESSLAVMNLMSLVVCGISLNKKSQLSTVIASNME